MPPKSKPPAPAPSSLAPFVPAALFILSTLSWAALEYYTIQGYDWGYAGYDLRIESLSDLGVDYRQVHPLKHYNVTSYYYLYQNINFFQAGAVFALGQLGLLYFSRGRATQQMATARMVRGVVSVLYAVGMGLVGGIHGGPREKFWKIIGWHWFGFALVAISGNLNSILAAAQAIQIGAYEGNVIYRAVSGILGVMGFYGYWRFMTLEEWDFQTYIGLWQRVTVYSVLAWQLATAVAISVHGVLGAPSRAKPKKA